MFDVRQQISGFVFLLAVLLIGFGCSREAEDATEDAAGSSGYPDIVLIVADDLGWADIGYHGSHIRTPQLDRLADEGLRLEQFYAMPTCTPTRVGLITGKYPSRYGVLSPAYGRIFDDSTVTLPMVLSSIGYTTAISGKWHMGSPPEFTPLRYGFDISYGYFHGQVDPYTHIYKTGVPTWHRNDRHVEEKGHVTDLITAEAVRVIREEATEHPLFLYVAYSVPHYPLEEHETWTQMYENVEPVSRRWYEASVSHMDAGIGEILQAIRESRNAENTFVAFMSDNGGQREWESQTEYNGAYAEKPHTVLGDNRPLRGWKGGLYEGGIRVPAVIRFPGRIKPGILNEPFHVVDWMPTLCALVGIKARPDWDGANMLDRLTSADSRPSSPPSERHLYWKTPRGVAVRLSDWKLILPRDSEEPELYDLANDPLEEHDLASEEPDRVESLRNLLQEIAEQDIERSEEE